MGYTTGVVTTADFENRQTHDKPRSGVKQSTTSERKKRDNSKALPDKRKKRK